MTYYLDPFGCVKNQVDAENMMASLDRAGWAAAEEAKNADLIIVNSCGFIESAKRESINAVLHWRKLHPKKKILLAGCLAQRYAEVLPLELKEADGFFGIDDLGAIVRAAEETVKKARRAAEKTVKPVCKTFNRTVKLPRKIATAPGAPDTGLRPLLSLPGSAYVKISEGCDNCCSYCAIPLIRGGVKSRSVRDIVSECRKLLSRGIKELCLIAQDLGSYGKDFNKKSAASLPLLLEALSALKGNFRVRLLYIHPDNFPLSILDIIENDARFLPYFDIPFQHGSDKILKAMNRRGNAAIYLDLIKTIRSRLSSVPDLDVVIRSTFLTGFPGETEEDFEQLLDFQKKARLDWVGCFAYSREEGTAAYGMKGRVAKKIALQRKLLVEEQQIPITEKQMDRFIGRTFDVLVEENFSFDNTNTGKNKTDNHKAAKTKTTDESEEGFLYLGRLPCQAPEIDGSAVILSSRPLKLGAMIPSRVIARAGFDLNVRPVE